jgi:hypothetical protein
MRNPFAMFVPMLCRGFAGLKQGARSLSDKREFLPIGALLPGPGKFSQFATVRRGGTLRALTLRMSLVTHCKEAT